MTTQPASNQQRFLISLQQTITFLFLIYVLYLLGRSAWLNAQSTKKVTDLENQIAQLRDENDRLTYLIAYEKTDSFREVEARRKLGLKKPGELVIALPAEPTDSPTKETSPNHTTTTATPTQILEAWWTYYTG